MKKFYLHYSGLKVARDGEIWIPKSGGQPEHFTYGTNNGNIRFRVEYKGKKYYPHKLVAEVFLNNNKPIPKGYHVHHIDGNPTNNRVENLLILTHIEHKHIHLIKSSYINIGKDLQKWSQ